MDQHMPKRTLRPTASMPSTAETYGQKHGIDPNLTLALQNIGRRGRQSIAQPSFARTSTAPVISFNAPAQGQGAFQTSHEIMEQAKGIVNIEAWRSSTRELRPYGSTSTIGEQDESQGQAGGEGSARRASFGGGGGGGDDRYRDRGMKRAQGDQEEEEEEEGTEVDEDEFQGAHHQHQNQNQDGAEAEEFPAVFQSPNLSQPELFHQKQKQTRFAVPPLPDRMKRGLPARRALGKTASAPVGRLGGGMGMDVDMDGEVQDGFDISEWAGKEDF